MNARLREPAVRRIVERLCGLSPAAIHELACYIDELERNDVLDQDRRIQHRVAQQVQNGMAMTPRLVMIRGRRADGGLTLILDAVDVAESVRISIPTTGGQTCRCPASARPTWKCLVRQA